ncbi:hypothetical protein JDV76_10315 [Corynebacterium sp. CCM 8864]|uniref:Uncharacterized protein n=3 Tax=Corynebacterium marambiense TaxID=2765364 RepID=A0ABS0VY89_9CORY|nr:hypothetical protein [Corynebacterium marambiense]MBI9001356.1 hypothetical protein [Corynebacterium marambiense]
MTAPTTTAEPTTTPDDQEEDGEGSSIGPDLMKTLVTSPINGIMSIFVMIGAGAIFGVILQHLVVLFKK